MQVQTNLVTDAPRTVIDLLVEQQLIETARSHVTHPHLLTSLHFVHFSHSSDWFKNI